MIHHSLSHDHDTARRPTAAGQDAGWSSPVARQAHNLKAAGSNPAPATNLNCEAERDASRGARSRPQSQHRRKLPPHLDREGRASGSVGEGISRTSRSAPRTCSRAAAASSPISASCNAATFSRYMSASFGISRGAGASATASSASSAALRASASFSAAIDGRRSADSRRRHRPDCLIFFSIRFSSSRWPSCATALSFCSRFHSAMKPRTKAA